MIYFKKERRVNSILVIKKRGNKFPPLFCLYKNGDNVNAAAAIQGADLQSTKLWWAK